MATQTFVGRDGSDASRRTLYRHTKRMLLRLLPRRWRGPRNALELRSDGSFSPGRGASGVATWVRTSGSAGTWVAGGFFEISESVEFGGRSMP